MAKLKFDDIEEYKEEAKTASTVQLGTIVEIPIDLIDIGENIRNVEEDDESKLRQIGESILQDGQIEPCIVYQQGKRYIIKAGSRRYKACMLCDVPTLKCIIDKKFDNEKERIIYQATENEHRENMNSRERESYMSRLIELGMNQTEIAKALHKGKGWVSEALTAHSLLEKNEDLNDLIKDDQMSTRDAWELSQLDKDTLENVKKSVKEKGGTKKALKEAIKEEKNKKNEKKEENKEDKIENEEELNKQIDEDFGIEFSMDESEDQNIDVPEIEEENIETFDGNFVITIDENNKKLNIEIDSFDKKLSSFIKQQIENYYINKGYTVD